MSQVDNKNSFAAKRTTAGRRREDDWMCPNCGNVNFSFRTSCNMRNRTQSRPADQNYKFTPRPLQAPAPYMGVPPYGTYGTSLPPYEVPYAGSSTYHYYNYGSRRLSGGSPYRHLPLSCPPPYIGGDGIRDNDDWACPKCGNVNFSYITVCNMRKCNTPKPAPQGPNSGKNSKPDVPEGSWKCEECNNINYPFRTKCNRRNCGADKPSESNNNKSPTEPVEASNQMEEHKDNHGEQKDNKKEVEGEVKSQPRVCEICFKEFSSGKALGGHKSSAHSKGKGQKIKSCSNKKPMKRKYKNNKDEESGDSYDGFIDEFDDEDDDYYYNSQRLIGKLGSKNRKFEFTCTYCDKKIPTKKSLFGHMRCHSDTPHTEEVEEEEGEIINQENGISSNATAAPVIDLAKGLGGLRWFRKGRRGNSSSAMGYKSAPPPPPPPPPPPLPCQPLGDNKGHRCSSCGKIFTTHQALGGHRSRHNKFRMSIHNTIYDELVLPPAPPSIEDNKFASKGRRICKIEKKNDDTTEEVRKVFDFDLNKLPKEEN